MEIQKMDAEKWYGFVKAEFEKLVSCKAGKLLTEGRTRIGDRPQYSQEERLAIIEKAQTRLQVELIGRMTDAIKGASLATVWDDGDYYEFIQDNFDTLDTVIREFELFLHPDMDDYTRRHDTINEEVNTRELVMRKEADNLVRDFCIGLKVPVDLNKELELFEQKEF